jgi:hypothetical protein
MLFWTTLNKKWFAIWLCAGFGFGTLGLVNPVAAFWAVIFFMLAINEIRKAENKLKNL